MSSVDVLSAFELNKLLVNKSAEVDEALKSYREANQEWVLADRTARIARAQAYLLSKGKTVAEREAFVEIECDQETFAEHRLDALRNGAKEALRARLSQLSAQQSMASALREELRFSRTDNYSGQP